jgi:hypothetical protein
MYNIVNLLVGPKVLGHIVTGLDGRCTHCWDVGVPPVVQGLLLFPWLLADVNRNQGRRCPWWHAGWTEACCSRQGQAGATWTMCRGLSLLTFAGSPGASQLNSAGSYMWATMLLTGRLCRVCACWCVGGIKRRALNKAPSVTNRRSCACIAASRFKCASPTLLQFAQALVGVQETSRDPRETPTSATL